MPDGTSTEIAALATALGGKKSGTGFQCQCPAHDDNRASLSLANSDKGIVVHCHAGCSQDNVIDALKSRGLWNGTKNQGRTIAATYDYHDQHCKMIFQVVRYAPKDFRQRRPDGAGGWLWKMDGVVRVPYKLPAVLKAIAAGEPIYVVEGEKDVDNLGKIGLTATCNAGGAGKWRKDHSRWFDHAKVIILPDNDDSGRDHAEKVAASLAGVAAEIKIVELPGLHPKGDVSDWLAAGGTRENLDILVTAPAKIATRTEVDGAAAPLQALDANDNTKIKQADELVNLALEMFDIKVADTGEAFALKTGGPRIALMFKGSRDALRSTLATEYRRKHGKTPNATALADAMTVLQGEALDAQPCPVQLRVAEHDHGIVIDLGRRDGRVILVSPGSWEVVDRSPVIFRRTALSGELPLPERNRDLNQLRRLLNVTDETWHLMLGWLVAAYFPNIPHPILMAGGEQGSGKTTAVSILGSLIDPSPAPVRSQPHDPESWAMAAAGSWLVAVDNVSTIPGWWSDCLCKAVTGDGWIRRKLYTDGELSVLSFRRVVALTSIDAGALRGDLGDRILLADLEPIPAADRRSEAELMQAFAAVRAGIFGTLLDLLADVLVTLPQVRLKELPRMADFAKVVAALDSIRGTKALDIYLGQRDRVVREVLDGDAVAGAVQALPDGWTGTAGDLLKIIMPDGARPHGWPRNPRSLVARIKRLMPALRQTGTHIHFPAERSKRGRNLRIEKRGLEPSLSSQQSSSEEKAGDGLVTVGGSGDGRAWQPSPVPQRESDGGDGGDCIFLPSSSDEVGEGEAL